MKLKNLIEFLPFYYKQVDTYKVDGKGVLERFLEICGTYLDEVITEDIESTLDLLDIYNTPDIYLNYLWEFLGELPFSHWDSVDQEKWEANYNGFEYQDDKVWLISKSGPILLPNDMVRNLIRYTITLHKIRGTGLFFTTLFRLYGLKCTINDPTELYYYLVNEEGDYILDQDGNKMMVKP